MQRTLPLSGLGSSPVIVFLVLLRTRIDSVRQPVYTRHVTREAWRWLSGCALAGLGLGLAPLAAHHVISAKFDSAKTLTLRDEADLHLRCRRSAHLPDD